MIRHPVDHHHLGLFDDHRWAVAGAAAMYLAAAALFVAMAVDPGIVQPLDDWWHARMVGVEAGWVTVLARVLDVVGSVWVTWPLRIGVAVLLGVRRFWILLGYWVAAAVVSEAAIGSLKVAYGRPRPPLPLVATSGASFPSGHAVAVAATSVALVIVLLAPGVERRVWEVRAAAFALVMGLSRAYLRAHWLTDVLAGLLLGAATALLLAGAVDSIRARRAQGST
ncbi:MAG: phosphatase PAP2 family protein [Actinobacteria bacterium]|nr:phosphatase PAP2 family protein [Actinomycetota bacterium]